MSSLRKNVAGQHLGFVINAKSDGSPVTAGGAGTIVIDGGSQAACAGTFTHKGTGQWDYAPTQAETNGTSLSFAFTGTGAIQIGMTIFTDNWDTNASLLTSGTGTDQVSVSAGKVLLQATQSGVTIPTVTTVTNQLTGAAVATAIWQDTTAGDFTAASSIGKSLYTSGVAPGGSGGILIAGSNAATTFATLTVTGAMSINGTGNVAQTGDSFVRIGANGVSLSAIPDEAGVTTLLARLTAARAGYLDTLNTGVLLSAAAVQAIWDALTSALTTAGSIGKRISDFLTGDSFVRIGSAGAGLTALGDTRIAHLDADVSTRSTYGGGDTSGTTTLLTRIPSALNIAGGVVDADVKKINGSAPAAATLQKGMNTVATGTVSGSPSTTSIPTSALSPSGAVTDQFKGRVMIFADDTITAALQGQATTITGNTNAATPTFTVTALTTAPASGDVFLIV